MPQSGTMQLLFRVELAGLRLSLKFCIKLHESLCIHFIQANFPFTFQSSNDVSEEWILLCIPNICLLQLIACTCLGGGGRERNKIK